MHLDKEDVRQAYIHQNFLNAGFASGWLFDWQE
jgi:hypothetical protein